MCLFPPRLCRYGGVSNATAGFFSNPADVLKVRMQMQGAGGVAVGAGGGERVSAVSMVRSMLANEGASAFMRGWQASVMREMSYSAIRMGLYDEMKGLLAGGSRQGAARVVSGYCWECPRQVGRVPRDHSRTCCSLAAVPLMCHAGGANDDKFTFPLWKKIVAGGVSGACGAAIANPTGARQQPAARLGATAAHNHTQHTSCMFVQPAVQSDNLHSDCPDTCSAQHAQQTQTC